MISIIVTAIFLLSAWKWGDWKNWRKYYPTMLYMVLNAVLFNLLTYEYPTWEWRDNSRIFPNHTLLDMWIIFTQFPAVVLLVLSYHQNTFKTKFKRWLLWTSIFSGLEIVVLQIDYIVYENHWTIEWSIFFNAITFFMIQLHHRRPLLTWMLSIVFIGFLCFIFEIPLTKMR
ncbi:hypothetical protein LCL95_01040 [Bacillus timonensis]|nr:hypothetical protein [Bacillus timonensis]